jgi:methionyl-tRNA formyltransferase
MPVRPILQNGDPLLREVALPVPTELFGTKELSEIIEDMADTLDQEKDGVAIAAPQIGIPYRIFLVRYDRTIEPTETTASTENENSPTKTTTPPVTEIGVFINPKFVKSSRRRAEMDEGCLSVRGIFGTMLRYERATVRAQTADGKFFERGGGGLLAQIFQHETDHLDGILFIDHAENLVDAKSKSPKKFVFFGTPYVASDTLEILKTQGFLPELIVTSPDRQRGRGLAMTPSETKSWALEHGIPVITPEKITEEVIEEISTYGASYGIVTAYGKILPQALIDSFPLGVINIHYSLLPKYRGASPVEAALLNGDAVTGVAIQQMVSELDAGDILALEKVSIEPTETTRELRPRLVAIGATLLADILPSFEAGVLAATPQDASKATRCKKIKKESGLLDLSGDAEKNWNKYRAYAESPGTYFFIEKNGKPVRIKIITASYAHGTFTPERVVPEGKSEQRFSEFLKNQRLA